MSNLKYKNGTPFRIVIQIELQIDEQLQRRVSKKHQPVLFARFSKADPVFSGLPEPPSNEFRYTTVNQYLFERDDIYVIVESGDLYRTRRARRPLGVKRDRPLPRSWPVSDLLYSDLRVSDPAFGTDAQTNGLGRKGHPGAKPKWDWIWAAGEIVALAHGEDGLYGMSQADIERFVQDRFIDKFGDSPAESTIRDFVKKVCGQVLKAEN